MKLEDDVRERLRREADDVAVPAHDVRAAIRRGRRRRVMRTAITGVVAVGLTAGVVFPLALLSRLTDDGSRVVAASGSNDRLSLNDSIVLQRPPGWIVLVPGSAKWAPGRSDFQLTNFDPGVLGPEPRASWLCPLDPSSLPPTGAVLVVWKRGAATGDEPAWPVPIDTSTQSAGPCGTGTYLTWRVDTPQLAEGHQSAFFAFAAIGSEASKVDVRALQDAFQTLRFDGVATIPWYGMGAGSQEKNPYAVIATESRVSGPFPARYSVLVTMWKQEWPDGAQICFAGMCFRQRGDGTLYTLSSDGGGGTSAVDVGNLRFSVGGECPSDAHAISGIVTSQVSSLELRLDGGRVLAIPTWAAPTSWEESYRLFSVDELPGVAGDVSGELVALGTDGGVLARQAVEMQGCS